MGSSRRDKDSFPKFVDTFYKMMMWRYFEKAAPFVHPESKEQFEEFVINKGDDLNITKYSISEIIETKPQKEHIVKMYVTYYKYPSVSEKSEFVTDVWVKEGRVWFVRPDFHSDMFSW